MSVARQLSLDVLAQLSGAREAGVYRYLLWRAWAEGDRVAFVLLNPSTATETEEDPTIRRCRGFARTWGFSGFEVVNLFALRSTKPAAIYEHADPVGPVNDLMIADAVQRCARVVCAWGNGGRAKPAPLLLVRAKAVIEELFAGGLKPWCFRLTDAGQPEHPLYQPTTRELVRLSTEDS
jgi:hypothetical protein